MFGHNTVMYKILELQFFFVYLHEKHTKILDSNLEKTRPNRQITEKKKAYIYTKKKQRNNDIFFTWYTRLFLFK